MSQTPTKVRQALKEMREDGPLRERVSLVQKRESLTMTLMKDAWRNNDAHTLDEPGEVDQFYFRDKNVVVTVLDQEGGDQEGGDG